MTVAELMAELAVQGTERNRQLFPRHGIRPPLFGVGFARLDKLAKQIGICHDLAQQLWGTANHDARMLAVRIADPAAMSAKLADGWARGCDNYVAAESVAGLVARSPIAAGRAAAWRDRRGEWVATAGWSVTTRLAMDPDRLEAAACAALVEQIARELPSRPNRVRHEMVMALIAIGSRGESGLTKRVLAAARALEPVEVDHGQTGCRTPNVGDYIARTEARRAAKRAAGGREGPGDPASAA